MRTTSKLSVAVALMGLCAVPGVAQAQGTRSWNFDSDLPGSLPKGFTNDVGEWKVVAHLRAPSKPNVCAQQAKSERPAFNVALIADTNYKDVEISVRLLAMAGEIDQGGGVVWRARDAKNYYIARYNPLENNYRVYKVVDGRRTQLATADIPRSEGWHTLRIAMQGDKIQCFYDGQKHLEASDSAFSDAGKIGVWTKADAQTAFDDLIVSTVR